MTTIPLRDAKDSLEDLRAGSEIVLFQLVTEVHHLSSLCFARFVSFNIDIIMRTLQDHCADILM